MAPGVPSASAPCPGRGGGGGRGPGHGWLAPIVGRLFAGRLPCPCGVLRRAVPTLRPVARSAVDKPMPRGRRAQPEGCTLTDHRSSTA